MPLSRTQLELRVTYDAPAAACRRVLRLLPMERPGQQTLQEHWECQPPPDQWQLRADAYGNRRLLLLHRAIPAQLVLRVECLVQTSTAPLPAPCNAPPRRPLDFLLPSALVDGGAAIRRLARRAAFGQTGTDLLHRLGQLAHGALEYQPLPDAAPLCASLVLERGRGSCQDYAHLLLALCRAAGLPARYVAGYNPAEGQLHAWVEALIHNCWLPYDPTHGRAPSPGCVAVAVGRDYADTRPVTGHYRGAGAQLQLHCRTTVTPDAP